MIIKTVELKGCPSCGEKAKVSVEPVNMSDYSYEDFGWVVSCRVCSGWVVSCRVCRFNSGQYTTKYLAIKRWNTRIKNREELTTNTTARRA